MAEGKADACSPLGFCVGACGLKKTVEHVGQVIRMDAGAVINHFQGQEVVFEGKFCRYTPTGWREFEGIGQKVVQYLATFFPVDHGCYAWFNIGFIRIINLPVGCQRLELGSILPEKSRQFDGCFI